ncbi:MAG TPA: transposase [Candidatus Paceibacterota bacterium]|nr:transposase [Candidatus Paceibacterota bacterium]
MLRKDPFITGQYYHIYNRGVDKRLIFGSPKDYQRFIMLLYLANSNESFRLDDIIIKQNKVFREIFEINRDENIVSIGAWCLMPNHFHIIIKQDVDGGITRFMRKLSTGYSMYFNKKNERQGALFCGPFKSKLVGMDDNYMRQLFAYINLNPIKLSFPEWENNKSNLNQREFKEFLDSYKYSSYQDLVKIEREENKILNLENFPEYFKEQNSFQSFIDNYLINS